ncbi:RICIN domain-containing protein [Undibacterium parvum]|uniref:Uncharacterized protein n=1 Tax=Undibacterium parvum TaxID=401471 RepID=A0A3Q9BPR8_9BURK|nr:hypothetical protein [Undibacterium parvum]AZP11611.1 hypothetical protein EJN92_06115 [Undibacterium parvum]
MTTTFFSRLGLFASPKLSSASLPSLSSAMQGWRQLVLRALSFCVLLVSFSSAANAQSYSQFQNRWKPEQVIHNEYGFAQAGPVQPAWESAMWVIESVPGEVEYRRLRSVWKADHYLHIENGRIQAGPIESGWHSAMWELETVKGSSFVRLRNRWQENQYLHIENGSLQSGSISPGWHSAMWNIKAVR